jgi:apolipoprotein N-acyltransferase
MKFTRSLLAISSGILLTLAYPRWNFASVIWLWMFPLLYALWGAREQSQFLHGKSQAWRGFRLGYLAGVAFFLPNMAWVRHSSRVIAGAEDNSWIGWGPELMGAAAAFGLAIYLSLYWGLWGAFAATIGRPRISAHGNPGAGDAGRLFSSSLESLRAAGLTAAAWVACEWLRGIVLTGFGWNGVGVALHQQPVLIQSADIVGVNGLAFLPVFVACIIYNNVLRFRQEIRTSRVRPHADFWAASALVLLNIGYGALQVSRPPTGETVPLRVVLVQQNVPQGLKWAGRAEADIGVRIYMEYGRLTDEAVNPEQLAMPKMTIWPEDGGAADKTGAAWLKPITPDLVIWPESALPAPIYDPNHIPFLNDILKLGDFSLLTGTDILMPNEDGYTGAALMRGSFDNHLLYRKVHLVPFGEYLPLRNVPGVEALLGGVLPGDFESGKSTEPYVLEKPAGVHVIPLVCFEDTVGRLARKFIRPAPQVLVNLTNDGWFLHSNESEVHLANAIFRCVELRRPMARSCNTGVTCFVDTKGRIAKTDKLADTKTRSTFVRGVLSKELALEKHPPLTFYARFGDVFAVVLLVICLGAVFVSALQGRRRIAQAGPPPPSPKTDKVS